MTRFAVLSSVLLLTAVLSGTGCGSTESLSGDPADVVGTWDYVVTDVADPLNLRQGVIVITNEGGLLGGTVSAPHIALSPLTNVRYTGGELTFRVQAFPGQPGGVAFSLDPEGSTMTGTAYPSSSSGSVEAESRRSGSRMSSDVRLTKAQ